MTQLVLNLGPAPAPCFDNFVCGDNREALDALRALAGGTAAASAAPLASRIVYLWGPPGSGRSHLLQALATETTALGERWRRVGPAAALADFEFDPAIQVWLIDDCDRIDCERQAAAFHLFESVLGAPRARLASAGLVPPAQLDLMPELSTRLAWGLVLQLRPLSETDTAKALYRALAERGGSPASDLVPWLMTHARRDLGSLRALIDALDAFALERKRAITLPLLREMLQQRLL